MTCDVLKTLNDFGLTEKTYEELLKDCSDKVDGINDMDWSEINEKYDIPWNGDTTRKASQPKILGSSFVRQYYIEKFEKEKNSKNSKNNNSEDSDYIKELKSIKHEIEKEKKKLQTEKMEYNKWLREEARDELIAEKICEAIKTLPPFTIPEKIEITHNSKYYYLIFGDMHYGCEYSLKGLFGDIINEYSPEIFEKRMWYLLNKTIEFVKKENVKVLNIFNMGDDIDGILRVSQLWKLRYGVVESSVLLGRFLSEWLRELSNYVCIKYQATSGNHEELRMLSQPKGTFTKDNMSEIIKEIIQIRLKDNPNFTYYENPTGYIFQQLGAYNILGIHGEVKNMEKAIKDLSRIYSINIDYLIAGHLHHGKLEEIGVNSEIINVPSIIGVDDYSLKLMKTANSAAKILTFDNVDGLIDDYRIKLN